MKGRCPTTILTDLDPVLRDSIRNKLPSTKHVISIWSILPKLSSWFSIPLGSQYAEFRSEFEALYRVESAEDFELQWNQLVSVFGLGSDRHIILLFSIRTSWALSYVRGYFLARMATPAYSKSIDAFLKGIFTPHTCLRSFFEQVYKSSSVTHGLTFVAFDIFMCPGIFTGCYVSQYSEPVAYGDAVYAYQNMFAN